MKLYFSKTTTAICVVLALLMLRASYWQWGRYLEKKELVSELESRLEMPQLSLDQFLELAGQHSEQIIFRKVKLSGKFDFDNEVVLRNRRYGDEPGVFVFTPLRLPEERGSIMVNRGFVPLLKAEREKRKEFQKPVETSILGLIQEPKTRKFLAPADPPSGEGHPRVDAWLRPDVEAMQKQIPYPILPVYVEIVPDEGPQQIKEEIVKSSSAKEELLFLPLRGLKEEVASRGSYPIPVFNTVVPEGRHLGYVYEWAIMALATLLIGAVLQLRPPRNRA